MSWPVQSPDKNIVENLFKKKLQGRVGRVANTVDLFREVVNIWTSNTPEYVQSL